MLTVEFNTIITVSIICFAAAFSSTYLVTPRLINKLMNANVVGKDIHKISKPIVAEMGGIGILFGFIIGMFIAICTFPKLHYELMVTLLVIILVGLVGMVDDLVRLSSKEKVFLLFLAGLPLIWVAPHKVGILYLISMPIAVSITSNLTNMLAGLNGIESGLGSIAMISLTASCIIMGKYDVSLITMTMLGSLLAFLIYNRYPSRVFPGDVGTLIIGACIAAVAFIGRIKSIAFIILLPNIIDSLLKFHSAGVMERHHHAPTRVTEDGRLVAPPEGFNSLIRWILRKPMKEKHVVLIVWLIGILFGSLGTLLAFVLPLDPI